MVTTSASTGAPVLVISDPPPADASTSATRVVMLAQISGTRNGIDWPSPGDEIELPAEEAADLMHNHLAKPASEPEEAAVVEPEPEEAAVAPEPEEAAVVVEEAPEQAVVQRARKRK